MASTIPKFSVDLCKNLSAYSRISTVIIIICRDAKVSRARDNKGYLHVSKDRQGFLNYVQR